MKIVLTAWVAAAACVGTPSVVGAQTPTVPPASGFILHEETVVDRFVVQRWVSEANPEVSPAGFCECITVVYEGARRLFEPSLDSGLSRVTTVRDLSGDRLAELVISQYSGGAHCCESTSVYSIEPEGPRTLISVDTGNCSGELVDLDGNGSAEFVTCDAVFAYVFCSFAFSPLPPAVFAYDRQAGEFVLSTPRYASFLQLQSESEARRIMEEYENDAEIRRCAALGPALGLIYTGRVAAGLELFHRLYRGADVFEVERQALARARGSQLWVAR